MCSTIVPANKYVYTQIIKKKEINLKEHCENVNYLCSNLSCTYFNVFFKLMVIGGRVKTNKSDIQTYTTVIITYVWVGTCMNRQFACLHENLITLNTNFNIQQKIYYNFLWNFNSYQPNEVHACTYITLHLHVPVIYVKKQIYICTHPLFIDTYIFTHISRNYKPT